MRGQGLGEDVAAAAGVEDISAGMGVSFADYDNDGWMDLYVSNMFSSAGGRISYQRNFREHAGTAHVDQYQRHARGNTLFRNEGDGSFTDVSDEAGVRDGQWGWGAAFMDYDNDGRLDLYAVNGFISGPIQDDL